MDLTPGEKAVLAQIRVLYYNAAKREQQVKAVLGLWPPTHYETYRAAFGGLVAKQLISENGSQLFRITDAGMKAMGLAVPQTAARDVAQHCSNTANELPSSSDDTGAQAGHGNSRRPLALPPAAHLAPAPVMAHISSRRI